MTYNDDDIEPDSKEYDIKLQKSAIETLELVLKLSNENAAQQVIAALKFSYFPFSSFCMNIGDIEGAKLQNEYQSWFNKAIAYIKKQSGLKNSIPAPIPEKEPISVPVPNSTDIPKTEDPESPPLE